jgi:hypothetical protein
MINRNSGLLTFLFYVKIKMFCFFCKYYDFLKNLIVSLCKEYKVISLITSFFIIKM